MNFKELNIIEPLLKAIKEKGYEIPTPIQEGVIKHILSKKDILACAQTGTGKTAAFAIPILQNLYLEKKENSPKIIKALIITPTRELAIQIRDNFREYGANTNLKCTVIFGGVNQKSQIDVLKKGVDILVATPGRLLDLINQKHVKLNDVEYLVLDEADRMLDMGFIPDIRRVVAHTPSNRNTLLFSATMPAPIEKLAQEFLYNPVRVVVSPVSSTAPNIEQLLYFVDKSNKDLLLADILKTASVDSALIFTKTKHGANKLEKTLLKNNIVCGAIHGNKSQNARVTTLNKFKKGAIKVLIATDIASRGIDIKELSHVINYNIPLTPEDYVHRIGRTARAGHNGVAISLCDVSEKHLIRSIEKLLNQKLNIIFDHNYPTTNNQPKRNESPNKFKNNKSKYYRKSKHK